MEEDESKRRKGYQGRGRPITESSDSDFNLGYTSISENAFNVSKTEVNNAGSDRRMRPFNYLENVNDYFSRSIFDKAIDSSANNNRKSRATQRSVMPFAADEDKQFANKFSKSGENSKRGNILMNRKLLNAIGEEGNGESKSESIEVRKSDSPQQIMKTKEKQREINRVPAAIRQYWTGKGRNNYKIKNSMENFVHIENGSVGKGEVQSQVELSVDSNENDLLSNSLDNDNGSNSESSEFSISESLKEILEDESMSTSISTETETTENSEITMEDPRVNVTEYYIGNVSLEYSDSAETANEREKIIDRFKNHKSQSQQRNTEEKINLNTCSDEIDDDSESLSFSDSDDEDLYDNDEESQKGKSDEEPQKRKSEEMELWDFYDIDDDEILSLSRRSSFDHLISSDDYKKLNIERRVLIGPYKFKIMGNESKYGSLYRAVAKAVYNQESEHKIVHKNILKQMELNWDYYKEKCSNESSVMNSAGAQIKSGNPYYLQKSYFNHSRQRLLPSIFPELHAAASYFGFHCTLFDTVKDETRVYPFFCNEWVNPVPTSDVTYFFLRSGNNITNWNYELLIPIGFIGSIPEREIQVKFRNTILVHLSTLVKSRYPLEDECHDFEEVKHPEKGFSLREILTIPFTSRSSRKVSPEICTSVVIHDGHSCTWSSGDEETNVVKPEVPVENNNNDNNTVDADIIEESKTQPTKLENLKQKDLIDKFRMPSNRVNVQQLSYHNRLKLDLGLYYRNFMVHRTKTHDLFSLLSEILFYKLQNVDVLRDQVKNEIKNLSYMHIVSKTRRKATLVKRKPNVKHKNYVNLFDKKPDYGSLNDLESAAHFYEFSYVLIGCDSKYNFYWKESNPNRADEDEPCLVFFLYTYYKLGTPVHKWYFLAEEQSSLPAYQFHYGGTTIERLRKWQNHLYGRPILSQHTQHFGQKSLWSAIKHKLGIQKKGAFILHYVVPVSNPDEAFRLESSKETGAVIDKVITEHGAKNSQTHRLSSNGTYHLLKIEKHKTSAWTTLWSLKNEPRYASHLTNINSWLMTKSLGLWHSLNPSPLITAASESTLKLLKLRVEKFIADARKVTASSDESYSYSDEEESDNDYIPDSDMV